MKRARLLDPREIGEAASVPIDDAANIPLSQLAHRIHELPPKDEIIQVAAAGDLAEATISLLAQHRRVAQMVDFSYSDMPPRDPMRLWEPNALLARFLEAHPPGRALDLGCGTGRDAIYLAARGWRVVAVDHLPDALARGSRSAEALLVDGHDAIEWCLADLDQGFDVAPGKFDLVALFFFLGPRAYELATKALRPGGTLLIEAFTPTHRAAKDRPRNPAGVLSASMAEAALPGFEIQEAEEGWRADRHTLRLIATKPLA